MTICPKCKAENRPEAAFCARCGKILLAQPNPSKPVPTEPTPPKPVPTEPIQSEPEAEEANLSDSVPSQVIELGFDATEPTPPVPPEQPVTHPEFSSRPEGTIFGGRFQGKELVYEDEHENLYTVIELCQPPAPCVRVCSNPECRTIHIPSGAEQENFCTYCGKPLEQEPPLLVLQEADTYRFGNQAQVIELNLAHPNIHPPISTLQDEQPDGTHYYLVMPYSLEVPASNDISQVLEWGLQLASGLDYLHSHGVAFGPELDPSYFGLVGDRTVWRNFNSVRVLPMLADREKINNVRLLALSLYSWITGKTTYITDTSLHPRLNRLFHQALVGEGFTSGTQLAEQIKLAIKSGLSTFNLDYQIGRRTHPGQKRATNEDGLLCFTISSVQQGISQPAGIFTIADGMGGHATGDIASSIAIQTIGQKVSSELFLLKNRTQEEYTSWLMQLVQEANQAVFESRQKSNNDMGSTLACALMLGDKAYLAHLGDSRIYLFRDGSIQQLTTDHSVVQQLVAIGKISPEQARDHPQRNVIYRSLGEKPQVEADFSIHTLQPGDMLLLCSDGLNGMLDDQKIQIIIRESTSPQVACDYLIDAANLAGGEDNISIILVEVISA
jgi:serine/threonine protein phosphatase PrpC